MPSKITIGKAALSDQIFAGRLSKDGKTWLAGKQDVTSDVLQAIIQHVGVGYCLTVNVGGKPKYTITVKEIGTKPKPVSRKAGAKEKPATQPRKT